MKKQAFTLIEILIVISVIIILSFFSLSSYLPFRNQNELNACSQEILNILRLAQSKTLGSEESSCYGVHFEQEKYVLFKGVSYDPLDINNEDYNLSLKTEISPSDISLNGGGSEVIFDRITGSTSQYGTVKIQITQDSNQYRIIRIDSSGQIAIKGEDSVLLGSRIIDSRHIHFSYSRNIDTANETITLTFSDPLTVENIKISDFLNTGQFDWQGTVTVGGEDQTIRVHTHSLNSPDTLFCIHRDARYNNKALTVSISGDMNSLITYTDTGETFQGTSVFVGLSQAQ